MRASFIPPNQNGRNFTAPYVFVEYPKHVTLADGSVITVNNADEEAAATAKDERADERATLLEQARGLGLSPHPLTGVAKLREAIAAAQA
jgi:hypothetical protein